MLVFFRNFASQELEIQKFICAMVKSRFIGDKLIPPLIGNPYNGYINPYYWVDDHPLLYRNNGSLDPDTIYCSPQSVAPSIS